MNQIRTGTTATDRTAEGSVRVFMHPEGDNFYAPDYSIMHPPPTFFVPETCRRAMGGTLQKRAKSFRSRKKNCQRGRHSRGFNQRLHGTKAPMVSGPWARGGRKEAHLRRRGTSAGLPTGVLRGRWVPPAGGCSAVHPDLGQSTLRI